MARNNGELANIGYLTALAENLFVSGNMCDFPVAGFPIYTPLGYITGDATSVGEQPSVFFGWVLQNDVTNEVLTVIRGTVRPIEWIQDAIFDLVDNPSGSGKVEAGFNYVYQSLTVNNQRLVDFVSNITAPSHIVVGHSLGSAIATYMSADLAKKLTNTQVELIALASPMTGNKEYVDYVCGIQNLTRYVVNNKTDIVPLMPPSVVGYVALDGVISISPDSLGALTPPRYMPDDPLANHIVENYVGMLDITVFDALRLGEVLNPEFISTTPIGRSMLRNAVSEATSMLTRILHFF